MAKILERLAGQPTGQPTEQPIGQLKPPAGAYAAKLALELYSPAISGFVGLVCLTARANSLATADPTLARRSANNCWRLDTKKAGCLSGLGDAMCLTALGAAGAGAAGPSQLGPASRLASLKAAGELSAIFETLVDSCNQLATRPASKVASQTEQGVR